MKLPDFDKIIYDFKAMSLKSKFLSVLAYYRGGIDIRYVRFFGGEGIKASMPVFCNNRIVYIRKSIE
jgi:hypothetical protein